MRDAGIFDGDVLVVDKAVTAKNGHVVVAVIDGEFVCKQLQLRAGRMKLSLLTVPQILGTRRQRFGVEEARPSGVYTGVAMRAPRPHENAIHKQLKFAAQSERFSAEQKSLALWIQAVCARRSMQINDFLGFKMPSTAPKVLSLTRSDTLTPTATTASELLLVTMSQ